MPVQATHLHRSDPITPGASAERALQAGRDATIAELPSSRFGPVVSPSDVASRPPKAGRPPSRWKAYWPARYTVDPDSGIRGRPLGAARLTDDPTN
jgi:hypothetical protein